MYFLYETYVRTPAAYLMSREVWLSEFFLCTPCNYSPRWKKVKILKCKLRAEKFRVKTLIRFWIYSLVSRISQTRARLGITTTRVKHPIIRTEWTVIWTRGNSQMASLKQSFAILLIIKPHGIEQNNVGFEALLRTLSAQRQLSEPS